MTLAHANEIADKSVTFTLVDSRSNPAWHSAANHVWNTDEEQPTIKQIMDSAHLSNWNVRLEPVSELAPNHNFLTESFLVVRDNPFEAGNTDVLSVVGSRYKEVQNEDLFEHDITCEIVKRSAACTMEFDCGGQGDKIIQKIRIKRYVNDTAHSDYEYHHPRLLKLSPNVKSKCVEDCVNFSYHHHCHRHDEITITNGTILTNFNDGHIYMQYYAFPYDEDGLPMIPDVLEVEKAVEWYIKSQILLNFWFADDVANVQTKWQKAEVEAEKWMAEARYIGRLPSFSGMVNSIRNKRGLNKVHFFSQMDNKQQ